MLPGQEEHILHPGRSFLQDHKPYVDKQGRDLRTGGGTLFMGVDHLTYPFYDGDTSNGEPTLGLRTIKWQRDGWPRL